MELSQETRQGDVAQPADHSLPEAIEKLLLDEARRHGAPALWIPKVKEMASAVAALLVETGHVIPGAPPAAQILEDAKSFAGRLTLSNLALRILNMLAWSTVETPESKPARRWLEDYLEGRNHGPVGMPMLWPGQLPGICHLLREWGFMPTIAQPGQPSYVARAMQPVVPN
jgi:hypothetical protein